jgi:dTDP-4-amino-4,6-dideoxygalactose transaminase
MMRFVPCLPTFDPRLLLAPRRWPRFPLDQAGAQLFYLARAGIYHALGALLDGKPGTVLMPAYHHGVEVEAVRAAGARIDFYRVDEQMRVDLDDLERAARGAGVRAVYLTHFVGFAQPAREVAALCARLGLVFVEDCALALGSTDADGRALGSHGDVAIFCLYKSLPLPHGGLAVGPRLPAPRVAPPPLASTLHHLAGRALAHLALHGGAVGRAASEAVRHAAHRTVDKLHDNLQTGLTHLRPCELELGASALVDRLLARLDLDEMVARRRHNFRRLVDALDGLPVIGRALPTGACPLFVPLAADDKRALQRRLLARGVEAVDFWSGGDPACDPDRFPEAASLRRRVLELPCHQSLDDAAIDWVAHAVKESWAHA